MPEMTDSKIHNLTAQSQDGKTPEVDASAVLSEHMYKFVYEQIPRKQETVMRFSNPNLTQMEQDSDTVKECLQNRALVSAERSQRKVVESASRLDLAAISAAIAEGAVKGGSEATINMLKIAGAAPLVERVRLGAIQLRQNLETDAEKTFEEAYKADIARESRDLPEVVQLKRAAQKMYEELKLRRTMPDVFDSNLTLIDTVVKDGALSKEELNNSKNGKFNDGMTGTLIDYLLKNFDRMKNGDETIDRKDVIAFQKKVMPKGLPR